MLNVPNDEPSGARCSCSQVSSSGGLDRGARTASGINVAVAAVLSQNLIRGYGPRAGRAHQGVLPSLPFVFPTINIPAPFGGTPLHELALREGCILEAMPFAFYFIPNLVMRLRNYDPLEYYDHLVDMHAAIASTLLTMRRLLADLPVPFHLLHALRTFGVRQDLRELRCIRHLLNTDPVFGAFHDGRSINLPDYYRTQIRRRRGSYADLLSDDDLRPRLH